MRSSGHYLVDRLTGVAAPSSLTAAADTSSSISLSWTDNATNETGFKVERCQGSGCTDFAQVAALVANAATFNDLALDSSTTYVYRVRAYNAGGNSAYSNTASATTPSNPLPPRAACWRRRPRTPRLISPGRTLTPSRPPEQRRQIYLEDVTELRGRLDEALTALGRYVAYPSNPLLARYAPVSKEHFMQIRARVE